MRQGCPISPYIFILCVEIFGIYIRSDENINGIDIETQQFKLSQYADDTSFTLLASNNNLNRLFSILIEFEISGLKVNQTKTSVLRLGSLRNTDITFSDHLNLFWTNQEVTLLGIKISANRDQSESINYLPKILKIENILNCWDKRNLSLIGKALIIKSLALSQLLFLISVLQNPPHELIKKWKN